MLPLLRNTSSLCYIHAHVSLACKTRAHKQDMETSGSDSELERESGLDQASGSTSAIPTTNSDTSTPSSLLDRLCCPHLSDIFSENNLRIIGSLLKNNRLKFWESRNRIMGGILSIISQSLNIC